MGWPEIEVEMGEGKGEGGESDEGVEGGGVAGIRVVGIPGDVEGAKVGREEMVGERCGIDSGSKDSTATLGRDTCSRMKLKMTGECVS